MKYTITVIDDAKKSVLAGEDKTPVTIRRRTAVDFEVMPESERVASLESKLRLLRQNHPFGALYDGLIKAQAEVDRQKVEIAELRKEVESLRNMTVSDGFGSVWAPCETHECRLQVMRPGDARCPECETDRFIAELKESVEAYRLAHEREFEEIKSLRTQLEERQ